MTRASRHAALSVLFLGSLAIATGANVWSALEQRATREQYRAMRADDAEWEVRFKAARSKQIEDEARILWLQHQNLELAKKLTLTLRAE